ncbi:amino acid ABC transporter ATP-binding protein [Roseomonas marmotae]|uniref:Amino acid ABC transporter ATP-binding protein n=1 Tax=Roseomonas marmotae TaxID=2768161 RepID=A0ABS3K8K8_9PROT|nr:amino acid ABC transporter ATP-binding protein [Roseomonas marmotae]QTI81027.1 amino acid ABC transporter ATP-binding protein [Roseomonas marmotae]
MVRIVDVWKQRGRNMVLKGVHMQAMRGQVVCLLGPSGAGKSTLLRCINALEACDRGIVYIDGVAIGCEERNGAFYRMPERRLSRQRAEIGMVFQNFNLFPHMSVLDNIIDAPIRVRGEKRSAATERAHDLLARVGLSEKVHAYPRQLSGGQQQRIAIARALAMTPKLMLFDEPTSALDPHLVGEVLEVIKDLAATGMTMIIVTHEVQFAREVADTVAIMVDGVIAEAGPPSQVLAHPRDPRVQSFLARSLRELA